MINPRYIFLFMLLYLASCTIKQNAFDSKGERHGRWKYYYDLEGTKLSGKGRFRHGEPVRKWKYYTYEGTVERIERKKLFTNIYRITYLDSLQHVTHKGLARLVMDDNGIHFYWFGEWKYFDEKGKHYKSAFYKEGKLQETKVIEAK